MEVSNSQLYVRSAAIAAGALYPAAGCRCDRQQVAVLVFGCGVQFVNRLTALGGTGSSTVADGITVSYVPLSFSGPVLPSDDWTEN